MVAIEKNTPYGTGDGTYQAAGGEGGVTKLVDDFYGRMARDERFADIYAMHPGDIDVSRQKLVTFLCGWMGGPRLYGERFGPINIPAAHAHLPIASSHRDQWLLCMSESVAQQPYPDDFRAYLMEQLTIPANVILKRCQRESKTTI